MTTVAQAAERLGVCTKTIRRYVERGILTAWILPHRHPAGRRYRIIVADLEKLEAARRGQEDTERDPLDGWIG